MPEGAQGSPREEVPGTDGAGGYLASLARLRARGGAEHLLLHRPPLPACGVLSLSPGSQPELE